MIKEFFSFIKESVENLTFNNTEPCDLAWMNIDDVKSLISNTFESKIVSDNPNRTILKSKWHLLDREREMNRLMYKDEVFYGEHDIYFHIVHNDFLIIRGTKETLDDCLKNLQEKNHLIRNDKIDSVDKNSLILVGKDFHFIEFAFSPIPDGREFVRTQDGKIHTMNSMGCGIDIRLGSKISYYSDLLVGSHIEVVER